MKNNRETPVNISKTEFRKIGHDLVDTISDFLDTIDERPVTTGESPEQLQKILGASSMPDKGTSAEKILSGATDLLLNHSLFNGHPKFLGYITSSPAPIGILADLLATSVNPNVGANILSPMATEIEKQTVKWLVEFIGLSPSWGGLFVSGGNMANFTAFLAARTAKAPESIIENGISNESQKLVVYCSRATHTWIEKAAVLFGLGTNAIRWIQADQKNKMNTDILEYTIKSDIRNGSKPLMIIGNAGDVSTGAVDDLRNIARICRKYDLWFHVDGAYGIPAVIIPGLQSLFAGIEEADSIALDPHKWLYSPIEAGCTLMKDPDNLIRTFSTHPPYYNFSRHEDPSIVNFYEYGLQNSRGFRALKVWLIIQQVGKTGYIKMFEQDIRLSKLLFDLSKKNPELEAVTQNLSITTLRYIPSDYNASEDDGTYLNKLNEDLLNELQHEGKVFLSNAIVNGKYCLRACFVNFRTTEEDVMEIVEIIVKKGREIHKSLKPAESLRIQ